MGKILFTVETKDIYHLPAKCWEKTHGYTLLPCPGDRGESYCGCSLGACLQPLRPLPWGEMMGGSSVPPALQGMLKV